MGRAAEAVGSGNPAPSTAFAQGDVPHGGFWGEEAKAYPAFDERKPEVRSELPRGGFRRGRSQAEGEAARRPASSKPIQQLSGQVSSQDNQYQCGQPLLQLGMVETTPITSPRRKNQRTCLAARPGAKRAQSQAQKIEMSTKSAVLVIRAVWEGTWPRT